MSSKSNLEIFLQNMGTLQGDWLLKDSEYENFFANEIGAKPSKDGYKDCVWHGLSIDLKKCKIGAHPWLDLRRYSLHIDKPIKEPVLTLFIFYNALFKQITSIYGVRIQQLLNTLRIDLTTAKMILELDSSIGMRHPLKVELMLNEPEIEEIADFKIDY